MKRSIIYGWMVLLALMSSCAELQDNGVERNGEKGDGQGGSYLSFVVATATPHSRGDFPGIASENQINDMTVHSDGFNPMTFHWTNEDYNIEYSDRVFWRGTGALSELIVLNAWELETYQENLLTGIVANMQHANAADEITRRPEYAINPIMVSEYTYPSADVTDAAYNPHLTMKALATDGQLVMTDKIAARSIRKGIGRNKVMPEAFTVEKVIEDRSSNRFETDLERVVCQGKVVLNNVNLKSNNSTYPYLGVNSNYYEIKNQEGTIVALIPVNSIYYTAINGAARTYLFTNYAGGRNMTLVNDRNIYQQLHTWAETDAVLNADFERLSDTDRVRGKLIRMSHYAETLDRYQAEVHDDRSAYSWLAHYSRTTPDAVLRSELPIKRPIVLPDNSDLVSGIYFLENSVDDAFYDNANHNTMMAYGYYRLPYAKIYATVIPTRMLRLKYSTDGMPTNNDSPLLEQYGYYGDHAYDNYRADIENRIKEYLNNKGVFTNSRMRVNSSELALRLICRDLCTELAPEFRSDLGTLLKRIFDANDGKSLAYFSEGNYVMPTLDDLQLGIVAEIRKKYYNDYATSIFSEMQTTVLEEPSSVFNVGLTFYRGYESNGLYWSKDAALNHRIDGSVVNSKVLTYTNGRCFYRTLWNDHRSNELDDLRYASTRRNNLYELKINNFTKLGDPWDSSDPHDPFCPRPFDEDNTEGGDISNPDPERRSTYMDYVGNMLPWRLVNINRNVGEHQ